jgi:protein-disulfide isomerase
MDSSHKKDFFDGVPSKTSFIFGAISGVAVVLLLSFLFGLSGGNAGLSLGGGDRIAGGGSGSDVAGAPLPNQAPPQAAPPAGDPPAVTNEDYVRGNKNAAVTIIEYSDFECPFCGRFHPTVQQALDEYPDDVRWVYRHFPLSFHPSAQPAALASECIGEQGGDDAFWSFADAAFSNQTGLNTAFYEQQVSSLGLNLSKYNDCVSSGKYTQKIAQQQASGGAAGVTGTPGSFLVDSDGNSQLISGAVPYAQIKAAIEASL